MKNSRTFTPAISDALETRSVPSSFGFHASAVVVTHPGTHPTGTFSVPGQSPIFTATNGQLFKTNGLNIKPAAPVLHITKSAAPVSTPDVVTTPSTHPAGTFSIPNQPPILTATNGQKFVAY